MAIGTVGNANVMCAIHTIGAIDSIGDAIGDRWRFIKFNNGMRG